MTQIEYENLIGKPWTDRFFELRVFKNGPKRLWVTTAADISKAFDSARRLNNPRLIGTYFWHAPNGSLHDISVNKNNDIIADNKIVGHINYSK